MNVPLTSILTAVFAASVAQGADTALPSRPVAEVAQVRFHSDFWMNLHHTLYAAAWARRPEAGTLRALAGPLPSPLDAPLSATERAAWDRAVDYYDEHLASRDLLFGRGMEVLKRALIEGDLEREAVGRALREVLHAAEPVYRRHFWPAHDRANRAWIAETAERTKRVAPEIVARLEALYGGRWFTSAVRADVVWVGNRQGAYATDRPPHATISSGHEPNVGWTAVETVFHEFSHILVAPVREALAKALGDGVRDHGALWHVVQFYVTGRAVQQVLNERGIDYTPYLYSTGLFDRGWSRYRTAVEANWEPYVQGQVSLDDAIAGTLKMLAAAPHAR